jgi:glycosyltransferase involved in cell wall biosynthesis
MAAGLPIVATPLGAIPWMLGDGAAGVLVEGGDPAALTDALERLARDPALRARLGEAARVRQRALFDATGASGALDAILSDAAGRR